MRRYHSLGMNSLPRQVQLPFLLPKTSMVHDLADQIAHQVTLSPHGSGKVRVFEISKDGRRQKEFTGTEMLGNLSEVEMYAEVRLCSSSILPKVSDVLYSKRRRYLWTSLMRVKQTRLSMFSTSQRSHPERMASHSALLSDQ